MSNIITLTANEIREIFGNASAIQKMILEKLLTSNGIAASFSNLQSLIASTRSVLRNDGLIPAIKHIRGEAHGQNLQDLIAAKHVAFGSGIMGLAEAKIFVEKIRHNQL